MLLLELLLGLLPELSALKMDPSRCSWKLSH